jgi:3-oxoacyl-[acyl-carrier-protein] synthase-3
MRGSELARIALRSFRPVVGRVLSEADWQITDVSRIVPHQPNAKLLAIGARELQFPLDRIEAPVSELGNMGPASILVALSLAMAAGRIQRGDRLLLLTFGLGFTCGGAAVQL